MNIYWDSFLTFFRIGLFTLGGGYAMIPLIEAEVVDKHKWITKEQFLDVIAIAQSCPGVFAINISTFIGYKLRQVPGAVSCALGAALPSFLIILAIAIFPWQCSWYPSNRKQDEVTHWIEAFVNARKWVETQKI
jgi:chromate transporter